MTCYCNELWSVLLVSLSAFRLAVFCGVLRWRSSSSINAPPVQSLHDGLHNPVDQRYRLNAIQQEAGGYRPLAFKQESLLKYRDSSYPSIKHGTEKRSSPWRCTKQNLKAPVSRSLHCSSTEFTMLTLWGSWANNSDTPWTTKLKTKFWSTHFRRT